MSLDKSNLWQNMKFKKISLEVANTDILIISFQWMQNKKEY